MTVCHGGAIRCFLLSASRFARSKSPTEPGTRRGTRSAGPSFSAGPRPVPASRIRQPLPRRRAAPPARRFNRRTGKARGRRAGKSIRFALSSRFLSRSRLRGPRVPERAPRSGARGKRRRGGVRAAPPPTRFPAISCAPSADIIRMPLDGGREKAIHWKRPAARPAAATFAYCYAG